MSNSANPVLTVTQLTSLVRTSLESEFPDFWLEGEVSNVRMPSSGHVYFTLKDANSQIRAVAFRTTVRRIRFALEDGLQIVVRGRLTVYEPRGDCQVLVEDLEPKGMGALQIAFEQLKARLDQEGLFDHARKRALPFLPQKIGVVTSLGGAAIRDILATLHRRCPIVTVVVYPATVQGEGAPESIAQAIRRCNHTGEVDVLIVGRGGGSWEDLWCFNEELVVRAIAESEIPVVSAVGHEIDMTLADFVADFRAATPTAAGEAVVPVLSDIKEVLLVNLNRLIQEVRQQLGTLRDKVRMMRKACPDPIQILQSRAQRLDELNHRLTQAMGHAFTAWRPRVHAVCVSLNAHSPRRTIQQATLLVYQWRARLEIVLSNLLTLKRGDLRCAASSLQDLSPLAILGRGYGIISSVPHGDIVRSVGEVGVGTRIHARLSDGQLTCLVEEVQSDGSNLTSRSTSV